MRNNRTRNGFKSHTVKPMQMIEKSRLVCEAETVMKTEKRLPNDYRVPHKVMTRQDDDVVTKRPDTNKASMAWIYNNHRPRNKVVWPHLWRNHELEHEEVGALGEGETPGEKQRTSLSFSSFVSDEPRSWRIGFQ